MGIERKRNILAGVINPSQENVFINTEELKSFINTHNDTLNTDRRIVYREERKEADSSDERIRDLHEIGYFAWSRKESCDQYPDDCDWSLLFIPDFWYSQPSEKNVRFIQP